jgi:hypothetical protein
VSEPDEAAIKRFEEAALRGVREHLEHINMPEALSTFKVLGVRLEGSYPDTRVVVSLRWYDTTDGEDEYELWGEYEFLSGEEAGELIASWVDENN